MGWGGPSAVPPPLGWPQPGGVPRRDGERREESGPGRSPGSASRNGLVLPLQVRRRSGSESLLIPGPGHVKKRVHCRGARRRDRNWRTEPGHAIARRGDTRLEPAAGGGHRRRGAALGAAARTCCRLACGSSPPVRRPPPCSPHRAGTPRAAPDGTHVPRFPRGPGGSRPAPAVTRPCPVRSSPRQAAPRPPAGPPHAPGRASAETPLGQGAQARHPGTAGRAPPRCCGMRATWAYPEGGSPEWEELICTELGVRPKGTGRHPVVRSLWQARDAGRERPESELEAQRPSGRGRWGRPPTRKRRRRGDPRRGRSARPRVRPPKPAAPPARPGVCASSALAGLRPRHVAFLELRSQKRQIK